MTDDATAGRRRDPLRRNPWLVTAVAIVAVVGLLIILRPSEPRPDPRSPAPAPSATAALTASPNPTQAPSPNGSLPPPAGGGQPVGDYRCRTLAVATADLERDGFVLGTVSYTSEGGPVDDSWLVDRQEPAPGERRPRNTPIDLVVSSPFFVDCP